MSRDFTYIDDIVEGIIRALDKPAASNAHWDGKQPDPAISGTIPNGGISVMVSPMISWDFIHAIEGYAWNEGNY